MCIIEVMRDTPSSNENISASKAADLYRVVWALSPWRKSEDKARIDSPTALEALSSVMEARFINIWPK
jgi:hypothetical protein